MSNTAPDMKAPSTAMALSGNDYTGLIMVVTPTEAEERLKDLQSFVRKTMVKGVDYDSIQGEDRPPSLLQPGAQKLAEIYGFAVEFKDERAPIERWDDAQPLFAYFKRAVVTARKDGRFLGSGVGSCNSREDRYGWRWVFENELPRGVDASSLRFKEIYSKKKGKYFRKYRLPNEDLFTIVNTLEKMACKRALIHAIIGVTRSSGIFTQDVEDMPAEVVGGRSDADVIDGEFEEGPAAPRSAPAQPANATKPPATIADPAVAKALSDELIKRADASTTFQDLLKIEGQIGSLPKQPPPLRWEVKLAVAGRRMDLATSVQEVAATWDVIGKWQLSGEPQARMASRREANLARLTEPKAPAPAMAEDEEEAAY